MKNMFLGTTGLVGAALLAVAAHAETPKVTVGGFIDFQAGIANDDRDANQRAQGFRNDSEVSIRVDGKSDAGLGYGAVIDLESDVTADADNQGLNASRTYVYLDGGWGRFELGSNQGAAATMAIDADNIAVATGGINGAWTYFANPTGQSFISTPELPAEHGSTTALGDESTDNNNKITYYSPRFSGFQVGVSYATDLTDRGQTVTRTDKGTSAGDVFDLGANWEGKFDAIDLGLAATGTFANADQGVEDLSAYNVGGKVGYMGFSIAGSYGNWNDSLRAKTAGGNNNDSDYYTLGAAYEGGPFGVSATYLNSTVENGAAADNDFDNFVVGADYKLAPGLTPYAEVSFYDFDAAGRVNDNEGTVLLLGTQLAF